MSFQFLPGCQGDCALEGETFAAILRLHGPGYHEARALVMQPLVVLTRRLEEEPGREEEAARNEFNYSINLPAGALALAALLPASL